MDKFQKLEYEIPNFTEEELADLKTRFDAEPGDLLLLIADTWDISCKGLYSIRKRMGVELELYDPKEMHFSWVVEFPMFERGDETERWTAMHHPFTAPRDQDLDQLDSDAGKTRAKAYDLVINGYEAGGGSAGPAARLCPGGRQPPAAVALSRGSCGQGR